MYMLIVIEEVCRGGTSSVLHYTSCIVRKTLRIHYVERKAKRRPDSYFEWRPRRAGTEASGHPTVSRRAGLRSSTCHHLKTADLVGLRPAESVMSKKSSGSSTSGGCWYDDLGDRGGTGNVKLIRERVARFVFFVRPQSQHLHMES